jgi:hypothetical protein
VATKPSHNSKNSQLMPATSMPNSK